MYIKVNDGNQEFFNCKEGENPIAVGLLGKKSPDYNPYAMSLPANEKPTLIIIKESSFHSKMIFKWTPEACSFDELLEFAKSLK